MVPCSQLTHHWRFSAGSLITMGSNIEVFADVSCPFAHVGLRRLGERRDVRGSDIVVRVRAWPLELVNGEPLDPQMVEHKVDALRAQVAPDLFKGFDRSSFPTTFLPAMALAAAGYRISDSIGELASNRLRSALFEEGLNVADEAVLRAIAIECGIAEVTADDREQVAADWREGQRRGVEGSPHFFLGDKGYFCPSLEIRKVGSELVVVADPAAFDRFLNEAI